MPSTTLTVRFAHEERVRLERDALGMALGTYIKWRVFDPDKPPPRRRGKVPVKDHRALANLLAQLGGSDIAKSLTDLANAARTGSLPVTESTEAALLDAADTVAEIRRLLIEALGLEAEPSSDAGRQEDR